MSKHKHRYFHLLLAAALGGSIGVIVTTASFNLTWFLGAFLLLNGLFPLIRARKGEFDLFEPIYPVTAYFVLTMAVRGLLDLRYGSPLLSPAYNVRSSHFYHLMILVFIYSMIALITLYIGYYSNLGAALAKVLPRLKPKSWHRPKVIVIALIVLLVAGFTMLLFIKALGGVKFIMTHQSWLATLGSAGKFYFTPLMNLILLAFVMLYITQIEKRRAPVERIFLAAYVVIITGFFFLRSSKSWLLQPLFYSLICYHYMKRRLSPRFVLALLMVFFIFTVFLVHAYRLSSHQLNLGLPMITHTFRSVVSRPETLVGRFYGADSFLVILDKTPSTHPFQLGNSLTELLYWYIPRVWWSAKPYGFGMRFGETYMGFSHLSGKVFMTPSLAGELYLNFGLPGIVIGFLLFGMFMRLIYSYFIKRNRSKASVLLYSIFLYRLILLIEGPIAGQTEFLLAMLVPVLLIIFILHVGRSRLQARKASANLSFTKAA